MSSLTSSASGNESQRVASPAERGAALVTVAALAAGGPLPLAAAPWLGGLVGVALAFGAWRRSWLLVHLASVVLLSGLLLRIPVLVERWPLPLGLFLGGYAVMLWRIPALRRAREATGWLERGALTRTTRLMLATFIAVSAVSLVTWRYATERDLGGFMRLVPDLPLGLLLPGIVLVACLNAAFEELIWRGVVQHTIEGILGSPSAACALQALAFGLWHFNGFPGGWAGVGLAAIFAAMMGALRLSSRGMLAPWLGHVAADTTIFGLMVAMARGAR